MNVKKTYGDGRYYEGEVNAEGAAEGYGLCDYCDGMKYRGCWKNDRWDGQGTLSYPSGWKFTGKFREGYFDGLFTIKAPDETVITGTFERGCICDGGYTAGIGSAEITWTDGTTYRGGINGYFEPHGYGTLETKNGDIISGEFRDGAEDGMVTIRRMDCLEMKGEKHAEAMLGPWTFQWPDRRVYADVKDGRLGRYGEILGVCEARIEYSDGDIYTGGVNEYLEPDGYGRMEKKNGETVSGEWENGSRKE